MYHDVECPYCEKGLEIDHDDGYGYQQDETHEQWCKYCDKNFAYTTSISFYYEAKQADCLNGGKHQWEKWRIFPEYWPDAKRCTDCGMEVRGVLDKNALQQQEAKP